jgi:hypothetical protein
MTKCSSVVQKQYRLSHSGTNKIEAKQAIIADEILKYIFRLSHVRKIRKTSAGMIQIETVKLLHRVDEGR